MGEIGGFSKVFQNLEEFWLCCDAFAPLLPNGHTKAKRYAKTG
jgi:hypothetical protein